MNNKFFMTYVEGGSTPTIKHTCKNSAENEAQRLANKLSKKAFVLEAVSETTPYEINIKVDSFEAALEYLRRENNACMCSIPDKHAKAMMAMYQLITIAEAWNKADNFVPDYDNTNQSKWFLWFQKRGTAGFVCANTIYAGTAANAYFGSRLCFKSEVRAKQFGKQFIDLWNDFLLF
ncbi:MAG: hypothetical protein RRY05_09715 [Bacteroidales bacterium]